MTGTRGELERKASGSMGIVFSALATKMGPLGTQGAGEKRNPPNLVHSTMGQRLKLLAI
jgi:hypothetical protein